MQTKIRVETTKTKIKSRIVACSHRQLVYSRRRQANVVYEIWRCKLCGKLVRRGIYDIKNFWG
jgi:ribosomal protein L37AE/L43A